MAGHPGMSPREQAALDQFAARFRDMNTALCASLQAAADAASAALAGMRPFLDEAQVTALQLAVEDTEAMATHPDLAQAEQHLDQCWSGP